MVGVFAVVASGKDEIANELSNKYKDILYPEIEKKQEFISQADLSMSESVLLFFSFDIVNSSVYKSNNYYGWSTVIDFVLSTIRKAVRNQIGLTDAEVWRILGDEVVFIIRVRSKEAIREYISAIYKVLVEYCESIENGELWSSINQQNRFADFSIFQELVSLQASAWIANVVEKKNTLVSQINVDNVFEEIEEKNGIKFYEFTGIDIDAGFRISKHTRAKRLVLSFELAYILSQNSTTNNNLHIITYCTLKGIWNNKVYPIIWYYDPLLHNGVSFEDSIPFDAKSNDSIYAELLGDKQFHLSMYNNAHIALEKVCKDRRMRYKITRLEESIEKQTDALKQYLIDPKLELHLVAVCYNNNKEILTIQRNNERFLADKWEFGCAKANLTTEIEDIIKREYKQDFGIDIEVIIDNDREDCQPIPLAVYSIPKDQELHKGVIFLAKIIGGDITLNPKKHRQHKFIKESDLPSINKEEYVNDAVDTLKKAFKMINEIEL